MARIDALSIELQTTGKDKLAEEYGKVIENLQAVTLASRLKNEFGDFAGLHGLQRVCAGPVRQRGRGTRDHLHRRVGEPSDQYPHRPFRRLDLAGPGHRNAVHPLRNPGPVQQRLCGHHQDQKEKRRLKGALNMNLRL